MALDCAPFPLTPAERAPLPALRRAFLADVVVHRRRSVYPLDAYLLLYEVRPAPRTIEVVARAIAQAPTTVEIPGYLYVFRDQRDPAHLVKIGRTCQERPERRIAQWRRDLQDPDGTAITLLWAHRTARPVLGEALLHEMLRSVWRPARYRADTGDQLLEYFFIPDILRLRALAIATVRYLADLDHK
jgi:hypothetical protein